MLAVIINTVIPSIMTIAPRIPLLYSSDFDKARSRLPEVKKPTNNRLEIKEIIF